MADGARARLVEASQPRDPGPRTEGAPILALQILRFLAATMVLVHHAGYDADTLAARFGRPALDLDRLFDGTFGVPIFFVLSGFIMVHAEREFGRPGASRRFLVRRLIRIVPLYWVLTTALILGAALAPALLNAPIGGWRHILGSYLFVAVAHPEADDHPVLGQGWTLNFEMFFYLCFAGAMLFRRRLGLVVLGVVLVVLVVLGQAVPQQAAALRTWTSPMLADFLFGAGIALARQRGARLGGLGAASFAAGGLTIGGVTPLLADLSGMVPMPVLQGGAAALIVGAFALGPSWPTNALVATASRLGDASYSLYLVHPFVIRGLRVVWPAITPRAPLGLFVACACLLSVGASLVLFACVERPITRALRRRFDVRHGPASPTDAAELALAR